MSDQAQPVISQAIVTAPSDALPESVPQMSADLQPLGSDVDDAQPGHSSVTEDSNDRDEQLSTIDQSSISLHDQSSARSQCAINDRPDSALPSRPSTASVLRPASAFHLPVDPRFPSSPSPQLLAILQAADEADRLTANSRSPLLTERSAAAGRRERPESAVQLGGVDTLQGLPSQSTNHALSVMQSKMRWMESTRAERAARVERRRDELLAEFEAEVKGTLKPSQAVKLPTLTQTHNKAALSKQPLSTAVAVL